MEKFEKYRIMCFSKKAMSEEYADNVIIKAAKDGNYLRKYACYVCGRWHLTSKGDENDKS